MNDDSAFALIEELAVEYNLNGYINKDEIVGYMHYTFRFIDRPDEGCNMRIIDDLKDEEQEALIEHKMEQLARREGTYEE